jgi:hypothetical protein
MYLATLALHSLLRWLVLILGVLAVVRALSGWSSGRRWTPLDARIGRLFGISLDVQVLLGLVLYALLSPITRAAFSDMAAAMRNPTLRFFVVEHLLAMIVGVALVHIGQARARKAATDPARHRAAAIFFTLGLLAILIGIPWPFLKVGRPLLTAF